MKINKKIFYLAMPVIFMACFFFGLKANAAAPSLTLTPTGDGDSVQLNVTGDPNKNVVFYYLKSGTPQLNYLGTTDSNGAFTTTISTAAYNITQSSTAHVIVNGQPSVDVAWPYISSAATTGILSLNQTSIVLPLGQTSTITAFSNGSNSLYLLSNSNPPIANVNINGSQITITANNFGATTVTICSQTSTSLCASTYVNVQNTGAKPLVFSQSNATIATGQNLSITVYGGTGSYILLNNSNSGAIQATVSGSIANLTANNGASGYSSITICSSDMSSCGIINANIGNINSSALTLSQTNPTLSIGQYINITVNGGLGGSYSVFSNSNPTVAQASISGNTLALNALAAGSSIITVCSQGDSCSALTATVTSLGSSSGSIALSQNNLWLMVGQSYGITISGGSTPYSATGSGNILTTTISGSVLTITGVNTGSTALNVCSAGGGCTTLSVLINGTSSNTSISLNQNKITLTAGNNAAVAIFGNGGYYISSNSNPNAISVSISNSNAIVNAIGAGNADISICQNSGQCAILSVTASSAANANPAPSLAATSTPVIAQATSTIANNSPAILADNSLVRDQQNRIYYIRNGTKDRIHDLVDLRKYPNKKIINVSNSELSGWPDAINSNSTGSAVSKSSNYKFTQTLVFGAIGNVVKELQKRLTAMGYYKDSINGRYLSQTVAAVKKFQKFKGIRQTGNVGILTLAALNK